MAKRSERLLELVHLLGGRRRVTMHEMAKRFEKSERTLYRDLADIGRQIAPVVRDELGYGLIEGARIRPLNLTSQERGLLQAILALPPVADQPPLARRLARLADKLRAAAGPGPARARDLAVHAADRSGRLSSELLRSIEDGIDHLRTLTLRYHSLSSGSRDDRCVDPYAIIHRAGAWYLVGHCHRSGGSRTFRLDRIRSVSPVGATFRRPATFRIDDYLADSWDIYRGDDLHHVEIRFDPSVAQIVFDGHHHASEEVEQADDGGAVYRVTLSHLDEIARWVLGFGGKAVVVAPKELVERVVAMAAGVVAAQKETNSGRRDGN